tara:strand:+ start:11516 stop:12253 length:738 start_codon:yes stop_codon:yes gene_type:complete
MITKNQIKYIKDLSKKAFRIQEQKFVIEGEKLVQELLLSQVDVTEIFAIDAWAENHPNVKVTRITDKELNRISNLKTPNQVLAILPIFEDDLDDDPDNGLTLFLDRINDPGNLGTIIRMADWFGVNKIICTPQSVDVYNSKVIQSSMGSIFRVPVFYVDSSEFFQSYKKQFPDNAIIGAAMEGEVLSETTLPENGLLVMGSESHGISKEIEIELTQTVTIPRMGFAESLNVAVATGIILWEWKRG